TCKASTKVETEEETMAVEGKRGKERGRRPGDCHRGQRVVIQHFYGRNAEGVRVDLLAGSTVCLWSGIKKGPPRKLKFPEPEVVVPTLEKALQTE
uniref:Selenoprotein H n=1 Tax=Salmo trutta TaxID=8032 RepID=A0A673YWF1_SALTR